MNKLRNEQTKGVITIFLLLTFTATFVLTGLLVDGGRVRMAKSLAEASLDNAASSVLSYYDDLLVDLYGLFASEDADESKIKERMEKYFKQTIGLVVDGEAETDELVSALMNGFDGYDFQVDNIEVGTSLNLGQTEVLKTQIIEHMKYRAPVELVDSQYGFLGKLSEMLAIGEKIKAIKAKLTITKQHKSTIQEGATLINKITTFIKNENKCQKIAYKDIEGEFNGLGAILAEWNMEYRTILNAESAWEIEHSADEKATYSGPELTENNVNSINESDIPESDFETRKKYVLLKAELAIKAVETIIEWEVNREATALKTEGEGLQADVEDYVDAMEQYIQALERQKASYPDSTEMFDNEIKNAKASAGKVLVYQGELTSAIKALGMPSLNFSALKTEVKRQIENNASFTGIGMWTWIDEEYDSHSFKYKEMKEKIGELKEVYNRINENTNQVTASTDTKSTVKTEDTKVEESSSFRTDIAAGNILEGATDDGSAAGAEDAYDIGDEFDTNDSERLLDQGLALVDSLTQLIQNGVDNLYINEYIMGYCRNYAHHYYMVTEEIVDSSGKIKSNDKEKYDAVNATQFCKATDRDNRYIVSEVEYILGGQNNEYANIAIVNGKILLIRSAFNLAAIFSDSTMYEKASFLCAWAGPLAPLATFALMVAWAVAESALDVVDIMKGEKVAIFKKCKEWKLSEQNAFQEAAKFVAREVTSAVMTTAKQFVESKWKEADAAIYDWYQTEMIPSVASTGNTAVDNGITQLMNAQEAVVNQGKNEMVAAISKQYKTFKNQAVQNVGNMASNAVDGLFDDFDTTDADSGASSIKLGYGGYLRLFLFIENETTKLTRLQEVIQMNMRQKQSDFQMIHARVNVWGQADCSVKYLFMTQAFVPSSVSSQLGADNRYHFTVKTNLSY